MVHKEILKRIDSHLDDLKVRNPSVYQREERALAMQENRLGYEVSQAPVAVKSWERSK